MGKDKRVMRGRSEWLEIMKRQVESGLTRAQYCEQERIPITSFDNWRRRLKREGGAGKFVQLPAPAAGSSNSGVEIQFPSGIVLRIRG